MKARRETMEQKYAQRGYKVANKVVLLLLLLFRCQKRKKSFKYCTIKSSGWSNREREREENKQ